MSFLHSYCALYAPLMRIKIEQPDHLWIWTFTCVFPSEIINLIWDLVKTGTRWYSSFVFHYPVHNMQELQLTVIPVIK